MSDTKFNNYFKSKKLNIKKNLINTYAIYKNNNCNNYLISNGYGILKTNTIPANYTENTIYSSQMINIFKNFSEKNNEEFVMSIDFDTIKNNLNSEKIYKFNNNYGIDFIQLKKIIDIVKGKKINIFKNLEHYVIEIIGNDFQVGYLLPVKIY